MFDIAWSEMFVIVVVALVVIGPKDLPRLIREVGRWTGKARGMAREFQRSFDDMVREAELEDIRKGLDQARPSNITKAIRDAVDPEGDLDRAFKDMGDGPPTSARIPAMAVARAAEEAGATSPTATTPASAAEPPASAAPAVVSSDAPASPEPTTGPPPPALVAAVPPGQPLDPEPPGSRPPHQG